MANWDAITVKDALARIKDESLVLPVIQRRLVWDQDKMELLFDTVLRSNSFGGIMSIEEEKESQPIFAFREFTVDGTPVQSKQVERLGKTHNLIIDGQQRLQSFFIGLCGSVSGKLLYFDLYSDYQENDFNFRFASDRSELPTKDDEKQHVKECLWYATKYLFDTLDRSNDDDQLSDEIAKEHGISEPEKVKALKKNMRSFYNNVFNQRHVGIARVTINKTEDITKSRQRIVELFRRLNDGGTKLSAFDLAASIMKGFDWKMESFLDELLAKNREIGLNQDNLIKLVFLLRDDHAKEMMEIDQDDATFAVSNKKRIEKSLSLCAKFLRCSNLLGYYRDRRPSFIPVYFIVYHLYNLPLQTSRLDSYFDTFDTANPDYRLIYRWLILSLLNAVFRSRGAGWIPYKTGIRKILSVMRRNKGKPFPCDELLATYRSHPLVFSEEVNETTLRQFDRDIVFNLLYNTSENIREEDVDHIQPRSVLQQYPEYAGMIDIIENYQLLDSATNRNTKRGKPMKEWILNDVPNRQLYLTRHHIPSTEELWEVDRYKDFVEARKTMLIDAIRNAIYKK